MPGGSEKQRAAKEEGKPFKLSSWEHPLGKAFYDEHLVELLQAAWELMAQHYPVTCQAMLEVLPPKYRLARTGFSKATAAWKNPVRSCMHPAACARAQTHA